jgi:hypothetical protein
MSNHEEVLQQFVSLVRALTASDPIYLSLNSRTELQKSVELLNSMRTPKDHPPPATT